jgi:hypothetical protein
VCGIFPLVVVEPSHNKLDLGVYGGASSTSLLFIAGEILPEREIKFFFFARSLYLVSSV